MSSVTAAPHAAPPSSGANLTSRLASALRLGGYVAFNLPRVVTGLGVVLLLTLVMTLAYVLLTGPEPPGYFWLYSGLVITGCGVAAVAMWLAANPVVPPAAWRLGSLVSALFVASYVVTRPITLPGLAAITGHWDFAPGTLALACGAGFLALHTSVLLGINVAYPQRRQWHD